ncbi:LysM peptidoglycan-binding domain-containing protein [Parabacteroides sp. FAFU027]|uniref:LysM peptidoglycan-binding domain-containing protein n=1 Tax=Parabacteroides sp. FAFU027 TaxID=2922715 RepID=UPI001FAECD5C|nr:LysM peptidoglycan-binding domain-containing protein [Parabacteroides sp. FAFU027]
MRTLKFLLLNLALLLSLTLSSQDLPYKKETKEGKEYYIYQVASGEGLYSICKKFNVTQDEIIKSNPDIENGLKSGQTLRIPVKKPNGKQDESGFFYHTIEQGETLSSIAIMYGVSTASIKKLNPESDKNFKIGFTLKIPQTVKVAEETGKEDYKYHTIAPKETLSSLAKQYGITIQNITDLNPGLTAENFQIGKVIRIDISKAKKTEVEKKETIEEAFFEYLTKKNETLYSISRKFNVPIDSILAINPGLAGRFRAGITIKIPTPAQAEKQLPEKEEEAQQEVKPTEETPIITPATIEPIKVAVLLPFMLDETGEEASKQSRRFIEYYEGLLLAVEKLRNQGVSINLYVHDTGSESKSINKILHSPEMSDVQMIIGPFYSAHITPVAKFAKANNISLVIPFTSKNEDVLTNSHIFQVNTPHSYLYSEASQMFCKQFRNAKVIFLSEKDKEGDKTEFINTLKTELKRNAIYYQTYTVTEPEDIEKITSVLSESEENIIVPTSGTSNAIKPFIPELQSVAVNNSSYKISLFGYPEWQTYVKDYIDAFYRLNTYIYSTFFVNPTEYSYKEFSSRFRSWYQRDIINSYPKYGVLGYDSGLYFLKALSSTGNNFDKSIAGNRYDGIQTGFSFERVNNWGGLINKNVYLIHYKRNYEIEKISPDNVHSR